MTVIKGFKGTRPNANVVEDVAALPYDVYSSSEARLVVAGKPLSFLNIDRAETSFEEGVDPYSEKVYQKAHDVLWGMKEEGVFIEDDQECLYLYQLTMNGRSQTGIVGCASIDDYLNSVVRKHENTRADKEKDRISHVDICGAQTGPIFLAYRQNQVLKGIIETQKKRTPIYDFVSEDGIGHVVWKIEESSAIEEIKAVFARIERVYIADGHHRAASAVKVGLKRRETHKDYTGEEEFNYFLSVFFPSEELFILDYNRVVHDWNNLTKEEVFEKIKVCFEIEEKNETPYHPEKKGEIGMFIEKRWYKLSAKDSVKTTDPVGGLDVAILQDNVLGPIFGIKDPKIDNRISFVGGIRGLKELEKDVNSTGGVAFAMYPTQIEELFDVADADRLMPPKSTWFEPKLRSGLFIHEIES